MCMWVLLTVKEEDEEEEEGEEEDMKVKGMGRPAEEGGE